MTEVTRAAEVIRAARAKRAAEMGAESQRVWGHSGAVTTVRPLTLEEELALVLPGGTS